MIEINQYIDRSWLPSEGCFLESFPELKLEPKKGTRYYYEELLKQQKQQNPMFDAIQVGVPSQLPNGNEITVKDHGWDGVGQLPEATKKLIEAQTSHIVQQVADQVEKSHGTVPGEFAELLARLRHVEPPKFDWKGYIRRFVGNSTKTYLKSSRRKFNIRMPDNPGSLIKQEKHILAAIDTSGSVSTKELKEFLNELYHLNKTGCEVTIIQCDTSISSIKKFNPRDDIEIHGRGGTAFEPVIDYYAERNNQYSCLIYFTDGECSAPEGARGNILWVLSEQSEMNNDLPGKVIKLQL